MLLHVIVHIAFAHPGGQFNVPCRRQVDVENRLASLAIAIEHGTVAPLRVPVLFRQRRGRAEHGSHERIVFRPQVVDRGDVLPRNDQHVERCLRVDVLDRDQVVVLMDDSALMSPAMIGRKDSNSWSHYSETSNSPLPNPKKTVVATYILGSGGGYWD